MTNDHELVEGDHSKPVIWGSEATWDPTLSDIDNSVNNKWELTNRQMELFYRKLL